MRVDHMQRVHLKSVSIGNAYCWWVSMLILPVNQILVYEVVNEDSEEDE